MNPTALGTDLTVLVRRAEGLIKYVYCYIICMLSLQLKNLVFMKILIIVRYHFCRCARRVKARND